LALRGSQLVAWYVRDVSQTIGVVNHALVSFTHLFRRLRCLEEWRVLTRRTRWRVDRASASLVIGHAADIGATTRCLSQWGAAVAWLGFAWFQKVRRGFADVLDRRSKVEQVAKPRELSALRAPQADGFQRAAGVRHAVASTQGLRERAASQGADTLR